MVQEDVRRPYVDYKYYKGDYYGKQIASESDFKRIEKLAEAFVDRVTFGRIARLHSIPDCVKDARSFLKQESHRAKSIFWSLKGTRTFIKDMEEKEHEQSGFDGTPDP